MEYQMLLRRSSVPDEPMKFQQFRAAMHRLQDLNSFPEVGDSENQLHKIVKKQMTISDYKDLRKNKRSITNLGERFSVEDDNQRQEDSKAKRTANYSVSPERYFGSRGLNSHQRKRRNLWKKINAPSKAAKVYTKIFEKGNRWLYYDGTEAKAWNGRMEPRQRRCPISEYSPRKHLRCGLNLCPFKRHSKRRTQPKQAPSFEIIPEEPEPANEWLDANKGVMQKVPSEFKPKKKLGLKIYHLRVKRKLEELLQNKIVDGRRALSSAPFDSRKKSASAIRVAGVPHRHDARRHLPRSFVIRINKKEGKDNQGEKISDSDENDNDEEDEESDEEEDEEDAEDEEDTEDEEDLEGKKSLSEVSDPGENLKDLLRPEKAVVTNRAKFAESPGVTDAFQKAASSVKSKKSDNVFAESRGNKKVLIDANIKVDSTLSDVLKNILKTGLTRIEKQRKNSSTPDNDFLVNDRGNQDQLDPELLRAYGHLLRKNPRFKKYFLAYCGEKGEGLAGFK